MPLTPQIQDFWAQTKAELAAVPMNAQVEQITDHRARGHHLPAGDHPAGV